jgi:hypothetical protein
MATVSPLTLCLRARADSRQGGANQPLARRTTDFSRARAVFLVREPFLSSASGFSRARAARVERDGFFSEKNRSGCARRIFLAQKPLGLSASDFSRRKIVPAAEKQLAVDQSRPPRS